MSSSLLTVRRRPLRTFAAAAAVAVAAPLALLAGTAPAQAVAGDPFDPSTPRILTSKSDNAGDPTRLFELAQTGGTYAFTPVGPEADLVYNALTFSTDDAYLYAITGEPLQSGIPTGSLIRIGNAGGYDRVGTATFTDGAAQINMGAFDSDTGTMYVQSAQSDELIAIDPATGTETDRVTVTSTDIAIPSDGVVCGSDFVFSDGFLWSLGNTQLCRLDPATGELDAFAKPAGSGSSVAPDQAGASWAFLDGDLGFSYNGSGQVVRIEVSNPAAATPTFSVVSNLAGSGSGQNDGAAIAGTVDLAIAKTAVLLDGGARVAFTLTVTNNGGADSTGWTVTDTIPNGFTNITVTGAGTATVTGQTVTVVGGALAVGDSETITVTVTSPTPRPASVTNVATVDGLDPDPVAANDTSTATLAFPAVPGPGAPGTPGAPLTGMDTASVWPLVGAGALGAAVLAGAAWQYRRREV